MKVIHAEAAQGQVAFAACIARLVPTPLGLTLSSLCQGAWPMYFNSSGHRFRKNQVFQLENQLDTKLKVILWLVSPGFPPNKGVHNQSLDKESEVHLISAHSLGFRSIYPCQRVPNIDPIFVIVVLFLNLGNINEKRRFRGFDAAVGHCN